MKYDRVGKISAIVSTLLSLAFILFWNQLSELAASNVKLFETSILLFLIASIIAISLIVTRMKFGRFIFLCLLGVLGLIFIGALMLLVYTLGIKPI